MVFEFKASMSFLGLGCKLMRLDLMNICFSQDCSNSILLRKVLPNP